MCTVRPRASSPRSRCSCNCTPRRISANRQNFEKLIPSEKSIKIMKVSMVFATLSYQIYRNVQIQWTGVVKCMIIVSTFAVTLRGVSTCCWECTPSSGPWSSTSPTAPLGLSSFNSRPPVREKDRESKRHRQTDRQTDRLCTNSLPLESGSPLPSLAGRRPVEA